ncbi:AAA domain-containing protein [Candidatus Peregrinibacteria bacterium]|jgi:MoxR-like ATPase|nr:AAA domain-containing protein [Candidatus Peregrinibacteria bacterium]
MNSREKLLQVEEKLDGLFMERSEEIHGLVVSLVSGANTLLLGPPGTAKSLLITSLNSMIEEAEVFTWLLTRFSTPEELFGPYSLSALQNDKYVRVTKGKLPDANIAFLDEIFKCNAGVLNALLTVLNERKFYNEGLEELDLLSVVGASNEIPEEDDSLQALFDRFLVKFVISPIREDSNFRKMLALNSMAKIKPIISLSEIKEAKKEVNDVVLSKEALVVLVNLRRNLSKKKIIVTDRTFFQACQILKAEAWLDGCDSVEEEHFEFLQHALWTNPDDHKMLYGEILNLTNPDKNKIHEIFEIANKTAKDALGKKLTSQKKISLGMEIAAKLKTAKKKLATLRKEIQTKGRDTKIVLAKERELDSLLGKVLQEMCGYDPT